MSGMSLEKVVFWLLCVEFFMCALLIFPMPAVVKRPIIKWISKSELIGLLYKPIAYATVLVVALFLWNLFQMFQLMNEHETMKERDIGVKLQHDASTFRAQRNVYLSGFCLFMLLALNRLYMLIKDNMKLEVSGEAMQRQAKGASAAYEALSKEKDELQAKLDSKVSLKDAEGPSLADFKKMEADTKTLQKELEATKKECATAKASAEAVQKQASAQSEQYLSLVKEKEDLEGKLKDFELLLGDAKKKEI